MASDEEIQALNIKMWREEVGERVIEDSHIRIVIQQYKAHYEITLTDGSTVHYWIPLESSPMTMFR